MTVWTPGELARFLESIDGNRNTAMFRVLALTGVRRGELVAPRWSDLDLTRRTMTVNQAVTVLGLGVTATASDRVFTGDLGEPLRPNSVGQAVRRLVRLADVPVIRLHDLRHTHASHLLRAGVNVKVVSERLGHASASYTLDMYGHVMPGQQAEAAAAALLDVGKR